jgi:hypothetical protein
VARALLRYAPDRLRSFLDFNVESPDFQTADGWYAPEGEPGHRFRWMGRQSVTYLRRETGERLRVSGRALLDRLGGAVTLSVTANGRPAGTVPIGSPDFDLDVEIPEGIPEEDLLEVRITADRSFRAPPDVRELSVLVSRIGLAAVPAPTA